MVIESIHTYLVHPNKPPARPREISGTCVPLRGRLFEPLDDIYCRGSSRFRVETGRSRAEVQSAQVK